MTIDFHIFFDILNIRKGKNIMEAKLNKHITTLSDKTSEALNEISEKLQCSHTKSLQLCLDYVFGVDSTVSKRYKFSGGSNPKHLFIMMTQEQTKNKESVEVQYDSTFKRLCQSAVLLFHDELSKDLVDKSHPTFEKYIPYHNK